MDLPGKMYIAKWGSVMCPMCGILYLVYEEIILAGKALLVATYEESNTLGVFFLSPRTKWVTHQTDHDLDQLGHLDPHLP